MEKTKRIQRLLCELYEKLDEVTVAQIAPHIEQEKLWAWCNGWNGEARAILNELEREVLND